MSDFLVNVVDPTAGDFPATLAAMVRFVSANKKQGGDPDALVFPPSDETLKSLASDPEGIFAVVAKTIEDQLVGILLLRRCGTRHINPGPHFDAAYRRCGQQADGLAAFLGRPSFRCREYFVRLENRGQGAGLSMWEAAKLEVARRGGQHVIVPVRLAPPLASSSYVVLQKAGLVPTHIRFFDDHTYSSECALNPQTATHGLMEFPVPIPQSEYELWVGSCCTT